MAGGDEFSLVLKCPACDAPDLAREIAAEIEATTGAAAGIGVSTAVAGETTGSALAEADARTDAVRSRRPVIRRGWRASRVRPPGSRRAHGAFIRGRGALRFRNMRQPDSILSMTAADPILDNPFYFNLHS